MPNDPKHDNLRQLCIEAVGHRVRYAGTNGNEYSPEHGLPVRGEGDLLEQHDSHGLTILVRHDDGRRVWVDPTSVELVFWLPFR